MKKKIVFELVVEKCDGYPEYRLKELIDWTLGKTTKVPLEVKTQIRYFYDYFTDFMKWEAVDQKYGIKYWFEGDEIHFQREATGELWGKVYEKEVL